MFTGVALAAFASGAAVVIASRGSARSRISPLQSLSVQCHSPALGGTLPTLVYLPPGYTDGSTHYRVIYFLHGLPAAPDTYQMNAFVASALSASGRHAIVVAPQGARVPDSDREYLDWTAHEDWPLAISDDLPRCIDQRFRTVRSRFGRALVGLSAGGYGAFNIGLRRLSTFGAVESWSGYFVATDPTGDRILDLGSATADGGAQVPTGDRLRNEVTALPTLIAFYVGAQDSRFLDMNRRFDATLTRSRVTHEFRIYAGGHSTVLWRSQAPRWLGMALDSLSREARSRRR